MRQIKVGKRYRHFKNKEYLIIAIATHSETGEKYVVYEALYGKHEICNDHRNVICNHL